MQCAFRLAEHAANFSNYFWPAGTEAAVADFGRDVGEGSVNSSRARRYNKLTGDRVNTPGEVRAIEVELKSAAGKWDTVAEFLKVEFAAED